MKITFRADASAAIGTGHIMRCLTLANLLKDKGAKVSFICAESKGHLIGYIKEQGFTVHPISEMLDPSLDAEQTVDILQRQPADLLVIDHYQIDWKWEEQVRSSDSNMKIMVIDDLANRKHGCHLLLDQNYQKNYAERYDNLVPSDCIKLLGPQYLLLRPEFYEQQQADHHKSDMKNLLIFYGGSDPTNETMKALDALENIGSNALDVHVVAGLSNIHKEKIEMTCRDRGYQYHLQIDYLATLMKSSDFALGAGGVTMWERCYLGLPSVVTIVADNQRDSTAAAAEYGAIYNLGWHEGVKSSDLSDIINRLLADPKILDKIEKQAKKLMQPESKIEEHPVVKAILEVLHHDQKY